MVGGVYKSGFQFNDSYYDHGRTAVFMQVFLDLPIPCNGFLTKWTFYTEVSEVRGIYLCLSLLVNGTLEELDCTPGQIEANTTAGRWFDYVLNQPKQVKKGWLLSK